MDEIACNGTTRVLPEGLCSDARESISCFSFLTIASCGIVCVCVSCKSTEDDGLEHFFETLCARNWRIASCRCDFERRSSFFTANHGITLIKIGRYTERQRASSK